MKIFGEPLVAIKVVTYNRIDRLKICISNILGQTHKNIHLIIFDDNSTDNTFFYCTSLTDVRITYIRNKINLGSIENFRKAISFVRGDYAMVIADDDYLSLDYIEKSIFFLDSQTNFSFVMGKTVWCSASKSRIAANNDLLLNSGLKRVFQYYSNPGNYTLLYSFYSTKAIKDINVYDLAPFDWHLEASMSYLGNLKVLEDIFLFRSSDGISSNKKELFAFLKFSSYQKYIPYTIISINSARHYLVNPLFKNSNPISRLIIAISLFFYCLFFYVVLHSTKLKIHSILGILYPSSKKKKIF